MGAEEGAGRARPWWRRGRTWARVAGTSSRSRPAVALLWWGLPKVAGVGWTEILQPLGTLHPGALALLAVLQLCALIVVHLHHHRLAAGDHPHQGADVNLGGSLVANTLPFGGAVAIGATYAMCRSWGFSRGAIGISIVLGGVFSTAGKVLLPRGRAGRPGRCRAGTSARRCATPRWSGC